MTQENMQIIGVFNMLLSAQTDEVERKQGKLCIYTPPNWNYHLDGGPLVVQASPTR